MQSIGKTNYAQAQVSVSINENQFISFKKYCASNIESSSTCSRTTYLFILHSPCFDGLIGEEKNIQFTIFNMCITIV